MDTGKRTQSGTYYDELEIDIDDGVLETLIIIALAATLVVLVYLRQQRALRRAQREPAPGAGGGAGAGVAEPQRPEDRGFFPRPDDPEFGAWVAGGVGH
jgi:SEL1 protein